MVPSTLGGGGGGRKDLARKSSSRYGDNNQSTSQTYRTNITYQIDGKIKTLDDVIEVRTPKNEDLLKQINIWVCFEEFIFHSYH